MFKLLPIDILRYIINEFIDNTTCGILKWTSKNIKKICSLNKSSNIKPPKCFSYSEELTYWMITKMDISHVLIGGYTVADMTCIASAYHGYVKCLAYIREQGYEILPDVSYYAAGNGQIACLKYLYENGCYCEDEDLALLDTL
jgi:uncharacterized protein YtpQ (UPF0354 family)